jgi:hypothetical protein
MQTSSGKTAYSFNNTGIYENALNAAIALVTLQQNGKSRFKINSF